TFDVIISDATDPIGPGEALFTPEFYAGCRRCTADGGILVTQNGVPFLQADEVRTTATRLRPHFADVAFYAAAVPTYIGGVMTFAWATDAPELRRQDTAILQTRFGQAQLNTRYYTPAIHAASFALPAYVEALVK
ncbi:MAG: polyamine aminopropyltransferase, partial [Chromatiales bacterium]|nr:polyamine aminopropyltransferase [Chromatiales bacterium]